MAEDPGTGCRQETHSFIVLVPWPHTRHQQRPFHSPKSRKSFGSRGNRGRERGRLCFQMRLSALDDCFLPEHTAGLSEILHAAKREAETEARRAGCLTRGCSVTSPRHNRSRERAAAGLPAETVKARKQSPNP